MNREWKPEWEDGKMSKKDKYDGSEPDPDDEAMIEELQAMNAANGGDMVQYNRGGSGGGWGCAVMALAMIAVPVLAVVYGLAELFG